MPEETITFETEEQPSSGRPLWSGTVTFGLVSVPVAIMPATVPRPVAFHMVSDEGQQLRRRYYRPKDNKELTQSDIVRGYEYKKGKFVVLDDDELERLAPERTRDIDLRVFVPVADIDPAFFVRAYYLTPVGTPKAYKLLARVMEERGRAGIATFVMRAKEYLAAIIAERGILRLETLRFANEIRTPEDVGLPRPEPARPADVKRIQASIARLSRKSLDLDELEDTGAEKLEALAKRKARAGDDVVTVSGGSAAIGEEPDANVIDMMQRLQQSLTGARKSARTRTRRRARAR